MRAGSVASIVIVAAIGIPGCCVGWPQQPIDETPPAPNTTVATPTPADQLEGASTTPLPPPPAPAPPAWQRSETSDDLTGRPVLIQRALSAEPFELGFPYQGEQRAHLVIRDHPRHGTDVYLTIERGQILCYSHDCRVDVVFDDDEPVRWRGGPPEDSGNNTMVFFTRQERFVRRLRTATTVRVAVTVYRNGSLTFVFPGLAGTEGSP